MKKEDKVLEKVFGITEVEEFTLGSIIVGSMNVIEPLLKIFVTNEISHHSVMSPKAKSEAVIVHNSGISESIKFYKELMLNIPEDLSEFEVGLHKDIEETFSIIEDMLNDGVIDYYMLITTDDESFDISEYVGSIDQDNILPSLRKISQEQ